MRGGLDDVVAAETVLSHTDRERGMIWVRGVALPDLVAEHGFEGTVALLWEGFAADGLTRAGVTDQLGSARVAAHRELSGWLEIAARRPLMEAVRYGLAALPDNAPPAAVIAMLSVAVPALLRTDRGEQPIAPEPSLTTAADLLRMLHGAPADPLHVAALLGLVSVLAALEFGAPPMGPPRGSVITTKLGKLSLSEPRP